MKHTFVEHIPERLGLDADTIYISLPYATAVHLCCCGCGNEVVTPLSRSGWTLTFDGTVSLRPSIGNWSFPCQSHYWIDRDQVTWARSWSAAEIATCRAVDARATTRARPMTRLASAAWRKLKGVVLGNRHGKGRT